MSINDWRNWPTSETQARLSTLGLAKLKSAYHYSQDGIWTIAACGLIALLSTYASQETDERLAAQLPDFTLYDPGSSTEIEALIEDFFADNEQPPAAAEVIEEDDDEPSDDDSLAFVDVRPEPEPIASEPVEPVEKPWLTYRIKRNDTLGRILNRITTDQEAIRYMVAQKLKVYRRLRRNQPIEYRLTDDGLLESLRYKASADLVFEFDRNSGHDMTAIERTPLLTPHTTIKQGAITRQNNSLFAATDHAGVPDAIIHSVISALETRVDFARHTRLGDSFVLIYEELHDEDDAYATSGRLLGFAWTASGKEIIGLHNSETGSFFDPQGESIHRAFLRSPLKFTRISSRFTKRRFHPVLKKWRAHRGVDFAAPRGTPVRASGDGTIIARGRDGGYGNTVRIQHFGKYTTVYAHLSKFNSKAKKGSKVSQGQIIGYVGTTGLSTGPHLHYEFRINGKHTDPLSADIPSKRPPLQGVELATFQQQTADTLRLIRNAKASPDDLQAQAN